MNQKATKAIRVILPWAIFVAAFAGVSAFTKKPAERKTSELAYSELQAAWDPKLRIYKAKSGKPLYAEAELDYVQRKLDLRMAGDSARREVWRRVTIPSTRELTKDFLGRLATIGKFELNQTAVKLAIVFQWRSLFVLLPLALLLIVRTRARAAGRTRSLSSAIIAVLLLLWMHLMHTAVLPADWLSGLRLEIFGRGWIPYMIAWFALFGFVELFQVYAAHGRSFDDPEEQMKVLARLERLYLREGDIAAVQRLRDEILEAHDEGVHLAFTTVRYCEWILPLLGFLGTVLGLGTALGHMQEAVKFTDAGVVVAAEHLNATFGGMAMSFYTTLGGLLAMLGLGLGHFWLRKKINHGIAEFSVVLTEAIERADNQPSNVRIVEMPKALSNDRLEAAVRDLQRQQSDAAEILLRCVREDPALYKRFGPILFERFVVSPAEYAELSHRIAGAIGETIGQAWRVTALAAVPSLEHRCVALIEVSGGSESALCTFDVAPAGVRRKAHLEVRRLPVMCDHVIACDRDTFLLRAQTDSKFHWYRDHEWSSTPEPDEEWRSSDLVLAMPGMGGVLLIQGDFHNRRISHLSAAPDAEPEFIAHLAWETRWTLASVSPDGRRLALAGKASRGSGWNLFFLALEPTKAGLKVDKDKSVRALGGGHQLRDISWISPEELLLVESNGDLALFDVVSRQEPELLGQAGESEWKGTPGTAIHAGPDRWFAAFESSKLSMWRVTLGGGLVSSPNRERVDSGNIAAPRVAVATDVAGRGCLVGADERLVTVWNFPQRRGSGRAVRPAAETAQA